MYEKITSLEKRQRINSAFLLEEVHKNLLGLIFNIYQLFVSPAADFYKNISITQRQK